MFYLKKSNNTLRDIFNDNFLDDVFGVSKVSPKSIRADLIENDEDYNLAVEIPGFDKADIKISYEDNYLTISAEKKENIDKSDASKNYVHKEIYYGATSRKFYLENIDSNNIKANYTNGILNVNLPKLTIDSTKKFINIE